MMLHWYLLLMLSAPQQDVGAPSVVVIPFKSAMACINTERQFNRSQFVQNKSPQNWAFCFSSDKDNVTDRNWQKTE